MTKFFVSTDQRGARIMNLLNLDVTQQKDNLEDLEAFITPVKDEDTAHALIRFIWETKLALAMLVYEDEEDFQGFRCECGCGCKNRFFHDATYCRDCANGMCGGIEEYYSELDEVWD